MWTNGYTNEVGISTLNISLIALPITRLSQGEIVSIIEEFPRRVNRQNVWLSGSGVNSLGAKSKL